MAAKRKPTSSDGNPAKKARKALSLETKMKVIKEYEGGKKVNSIARDNQLSHSTVSTIVKDKDRIKEAVKAAAPIKSTIITKQREGPIAEMEKLLFTWLEDNRQRNVKMMLKGVQSKATSLFKMLKERGGEEYASLEFIASDGWFRRFRERYQVHYVISKGEAASSDEPAAKAFVTDFDKLIVDEGYLPEHIFNVDETALFWKKMPKGTYISKEFSSAPGHKAIKERFTLLLGGNIAGHKLKPFLIALSENPRALKNVNKHALPVYYRSNKKAWMTMALFEDWFQNCFIPEVREYCTNKGIPFKILLVLDNAPGHPSYLDDLHPNVKVVYLPPNTTPLIQPMDQGVIATFKAHYLRISFDQAIETMDANPDMDFRAYWKTYNIYHCIKHVAKAWDLVPESCMHGVWKHCSKRFIRDFVGFDSEEEISDVRNKIVRLATQLELGCNEEEIEELINEEPEELTNEELLAIEEERKAEEERREERTEVVEEMPERKFTVKGLSEAFSMMNAMLQKLEGMDPNVERFARIERAMQEKIRPYKEIYEEKKKKKIQTNLSMFIKRTGNPSVETPQPSSTSIDREATPPPVSPRAHTTSPPASPELPDLSVDRTHEESVDDVQPSTSGL